MLYADRIYESSTTTGTGDLTLAGALAGFVTFATSFAVNDRFRYVIERGTEWEIGEGYLSGATTLVRATVLRSSNADALVSFSAGAKKVFISQNANAIADMGMTIALSSKLVPQ
jgi:hypothetical protein